MHGARAVWAVSHPKPGYKRLRGRWPGEMKLCFGYEVIYRPSMHLMGAFALWIFAVVLVSVQNGNDLSKRLDQIHTYQLQKYPTNYDTAQLTIKNSFLSYWDETCMAAVSFASTPTGCAVKRATMVTNTRTALGCDLYRSPACNCVNQITRGINNDTLQNSTTTPNSLGTFTNTGKSLAGFRDSLLFAIDGCHFLHHTTQLAVLTGSTLVRRTGLLVLLTTLVAGNMVAAFLLQANKWGRAGCAVGFALLGGMIVIIVESSASNLVYYTLLPPFLLLLWSEFFLAYDDNTRPPFVQPYFFGAILAVLVVINLVENDVLDYDNIVIEVMKAHLVSLLYFGVSYFAASSQGSNAKHLYKKKAGQDGIYIACGLAVLSVVQSSTAPYTDVCYLNILSWLPLLFVLLNFFAVVWVNEVDRFSDYYSDNGDNNAVKRNAITKDPTYVRNGTLYVSAALLALTFLATLSYWQTYSLTYHAMYELVPTKTIQINAGYTWLSPAGFAA